MTEEKTIEQQNEMIARFMGVTIYPRTGTPEFKKWKGKRCDYEIHELEYHESWDWLMPVVEKIESLYYGGLQFYIKDNRAYIEVATQASTAYDDIPDVPNCYSGFSDTKLMAVNKTVVDFIQWHNQQNNLK